MMDSLHFCLPARLPSAPPFSPLPKRALKMSNCIHTSNSVLCRLPICLCSGLASQQYLSVLREARSDRACGRGRCRVPHHAPACCHGTDALRPHILPKRPDKYAYKFLVCKILKI